MKWFTSKREERLEAELENLKHDLASVQNHSLTSESLKDLLSVRETASGVRVTYETAMRASAVYACVRLIAGTIGTLPIQVFKRSGDSRKPAGSHPLHYLLHDQPNPMLSSVTYWETVATHILLDGNHYSLIGRTGATPSSLTPFHPRNVKPYQKNGRLLYDVVFDDGYHAVFDQDDILHIPGLGWNGCKGLSTISCAAQSIGLALAAEEHSARVFSNGAVPRGVIKFDKKMNRDQIDLMLDYWNRKHQGLENAHLPAILTEGGDFKETSLSAQDTQLIESRRFQIADIARIFGVPPHMIGETTGSTSWGTGTGIEQISRGFETYTLRPYLSRIEKEVNRKLFRTNGFFAEFNVSGLLRGDTKGRHEAYTIALGGNQQPGWMTINEVRKLENLPPVEGADELYKPLTGDVNEESPNEADDGQSEGSEGVQD